MGREGVFEKPARIIRMEDFLTSLITEVISADSLIKKIKELFIENCTRYLEEIGGLNRFLFT